MAKVNSKNESKSEKIELTKPSLTPAPDCSKESEKEIEFEISSSEPKKEVIEEPANDVVEELKASDKPVISFDKKKISKTPKVIEKIESANTGTVVSIKTVSVDQTQMLSLPDRISKFNRLALGGKYASRAMFENLASSVLMTDYKVIQGKSPIEIAFEVEGNRVPAEGFYFIR